VALVRTNVSEEGIASIIRVKRINSHMVFHLRRWHASSYLILIRMMEMELGFT
jgi:hypothetical protein